MRKLKQINSNSNDSISVTTDVLLLYLNIANELGFKPCENGSERRVHKSCTSDLGFSHALVAYFQNIGFPDQEVISSCIAPTRKTSEMVDQSKLAT